MIPLSIGEIAAVAGGTVVGGVEAGDAVKVTGPAVLDGRQAEPGALFAAFAGEHVDGHDYVRQAGRAGAVAVLGSRPTPLPTLNVGQAHLGVFGSRAAIAKAKGELVRGLTPGGTAVLSADDPRVVAMRSLTDGPVLTFGLAEHADVRVLDLALDRLGRPSFTLRTAGASAPVGLPLVGAHQALNASAAAAAGLAVGVSLDVAAALATASLSKWRMEPRDLAGGARLLNDSYNANPDSTRAALDALASIECGRRIAVLGEMRELGDDSEAEHRAVGEYAASRADVVVAIGEAARPIAEGAGERAVALADNDAAVDWLRGHLAAGEVVLVKASRGARLDEVAAALA
jgi:UDP-N-acetylmuramoyl-tripeptide--D-alanyl-D-alanine ligase